MISICPQCGSYQWNKTVTPTHVLCPECGHAWPIRRGPLMLLTGCSGVGKTTTALRLAGMARGFAVLDADMFYDPDAAAMLEQICCLTATLNHQGQPVLWAMAGGLELIRNAYHRPFFTDVKCLALTCEPEELRRRMTEGRAITDEAWLTGSQDYNEYFRTHDTLGEIRFDRIDITRMTPDEAASAVLQWVQRQL